MNRKKASDFDPEVLQLFDRYVHGQLDRRGFLQQVARHATGGLTAAAILESLAPNYAWARQVEPEDPRIRTSVETIDSPGGHGQIKGLLVRPAAGGNQFPGVLIVHENRGLNPYIEDVARRLGIAGFLAFAPDALTSLGGYPGNDDEGRAMQQKLNPDKITEDFIAAARWIHTHPASAGKTGVVGFCFGGGMANTLAVRLPEIIAAAVPFYGRQPAKEDVPKIKAALLIHNAGLDQRILEGAPAYETALKAAGVAFTSHVYAGVNHGFHNDTTPRYDEAAATLAWTRTIAFFQTTLR
ncbi:MAG: dienelactone hydrolase family protein [Verrucomicrobiales bacterium]